VECWTVLTIQPHFRLKVMVTTSDRTFAQHLHGCSS
jgi:hypothetical protein